MPAFSAPLKISPDADPICVWVSAQLLPLI